MKATRISQSGLVFCCLATIALVGGGCSAKPPSVEQGTDAGTTPDSGPTPDAGPEVVPDAGPDAGPPGHHSPSMALPITEDGTPIMTALENAQTPDFYTFQGTAGDKLVISAVAVGLVTPTPAATEVNIIDTVATLFDSTGATVIAQDDDAFPRFNTDSQLFVQLPTTGTYYLSIATCYELFGPADCSPPSDVTVFNYELSVAKTSMLTAPEAVGVANSTKTNASAVTYTGVTGMTGSFDEDLVDGDFQSATDTQVFSFTPPATTTHAAGVAERADFWIQPTGIHDGDGSTSNPKVWVTDSSGTNVIALADESNYGNGDNLTNNGLDLAVPITYGDQYYLFFQNNVTTSTPATDYYFTLHVEGDDANLATPEAEGPTANGMNDTPATAQTLTTPTGATAGFFSVQGWISPAGTDVDWYKMVITTADTHLDYSCQAARAGSGLVGFTVSMNTLNTTTMMPVAIASTTSVETATTDMNIPVPPSTTLPAVPTGYTTVYMKVEATSQAAGNAGTYYWCEIDFGA